jgi:hypothetical protein
MVQTITVDIINEKAIKLLQDLEALKLIKLRKSEPPHKSAINWALKYKGAMSKQPIQEVDQQLKSLRSEWE